MNTRLGNGKVHATYRNVSKLPLCGGNKAAERYTNTNLPVDCTKCLKELAKQAEANERNAYYAGVAEQQDDVMSQAEFSAEATVTEARPEIEDGARVELIRDVIVDQSATTSYRNVMYKAGTRGTIQEGKAAARGFEYLVQIDGTNRAEWLYASEIRKAAETTDADVRAKVIELAGSKDTTMAEFKQALYLLSPSELREWFGVMAEDLSTGFTGRELMDFRIWVACMALPATATNDAVGKMVEAVEAQTEPEPWGLREVRIVNVNMTSDDDGMVVVSGLVLPNGDHKRAYWGQISRDHRGSFQVETKTGGRPWSEDGIQTVRQAARALAKRDGFVGHISVQIERTS